MNGPEVAALIVAVTGALAAVFKGVRDLKSDRFRKDVEASAALLTGYTTMVATLQAEIDRLKSDHAEDRAAWAEERARFRKEWTDDMDRMRAEHRAELAVAYERIDDLGSQVYALQNRPTDTRDRRGDRP